MNMDKLVQDVQGGLKLQQVKNAAGVVGVLCRFIYDSVLVSCCSFDKTRTGAGFISNP